MHLEGEKKKQEGSVGDREGNLRLYLHRIITTLYV